MNDAVITAGHVKDKVADIKAKIYKVMDKYEFSGNDEENLIDEDQEWVTHDQNDSIRNFCEEVLYAWKLFDQNDLWQSVLATLNDKQASTVDSVPATEKDFFSQKAEEGWQGVWVDR